MKKLILPFFLVMFTSSVPAQENYATNPLSPYPPACATNYQVWDKYNSSGTEVIYSGMIQLTGESGALHDVELTVWRKGCAEAGRSVILVDLKPVDDGDGMDEWVFTPWFWAATRRDSQIKMRAISEPNSSYATDETQKLWEGGSYTLFLENPSIYSEFNYIMVSPEEYNGAWQLRVRDVGDPVVNTWEIDIPAYTNNLQTPVMALTGRLSGTWVVPGVPDQGLVLAFEEEGSSLMPRGLFFLSWYTFDDKGELLWLTGNGFYGRGATEITVPVLLVSNGQFLGEQLADREVIGSARLVAQDCNSLILEYDLEGIGLGSGTEILQRIFSLEIQGYACRDIQSRIDRLNDRFQQ
jgi:hypothetical protein